MSSSDPVVSALHEGMRRFLTLVSGIRPDLHRYCARMTGSVADGEDIVQDTLARAYYALSEMEDVPELRPWLFQIAHNRALDHLRRYERRMSEPLDSVLETALSDGADPEDRLAREQATRAAISRFVELVPAQRSAVILKDVLGHSLAELAQLMAISEPAAKAALHRGRERLQALAEAPPPEPSRTPARGLARHRPLRGAVQRSRLGRRPCAVGRGRAPRPAVAREEERAPGGLELRHELCGHRRLAFGSGLGRRPRGRWSFFGIALTLAPRTSSNWNFLPNE